MRRVRLVALLAGVSALVAGLSSAPARPADGDWGTLTGVVKLPNAPAPQPITNVNDPACKDCNLVEEAVIVGKTGGLKNVVVWLRPANTDRKAEFPKEKIHPDLAKASPKQHVIDQPCCQFIPRVLAARAGDIVDVKNTSPANHNVNWQSDAESFNVLLPPNMNKVTQPLAAQRAPITIACNIHPWMKGLVRVFDHPYFAVTDEDGKFEIKNAPVGNWNIVYWHEKGFHKGREGALGFPVSVKGGGKTEVPAIDFEFPK
jgi:plastocyanin